MPNTQDSVLRDRLQKADDLISKMINCPGVRFFERRGTTLMGELGINNP